MELNGWVIVCLCESVWLIQACFCTSVSVLWFHCSNLKFAPQTVKIKNNSKSRKIKKRTERVTIALKEKWKKNPARVQLQGWKICQQHGISNSIRRNSVGQSNTRCIRVIWRWNNLLNDLANVHRLEVFGQTPTAIDDVTNLPLLNCAFIRKLKRMRKSDKMWNKIEPNKHRFSRRMP